MLLRSTIVLRFSLVDIRGVVQGLFDHNVCVVPPSSAAESMVGVVLPDSFFVQSKADIQKQAAYLSEAAEAELTLRTQVLA